MKKYRLKQTIITCYSTGGTLGYNPMIIIKEGEILTEHQNGDFVFENKRYEIPTIKYPFFNKADVVNNPDLFEEINELI